MKHLTKTQNSYICNTDLITVKIPRRYENYDLLLIRENISTLGIFEFSINNGPFYGFVLPTILHTCPSIYYTKSTETEDTLVLEFHKGDKFIVHNVAIKQSNIAYAMFVEFLTLGNLPKFLTYEQTAFLFDLAKEICDADLKVHHSIFEIIYSHLFRDPDDFTVKYRHTKMNKSPKFIELKSVIHGTDSTMTKLVGSYFNDGVNAAMIIQSNQKHDLEDLLRE